MREAVIVLRRELRSYFVSPIAYVFGILFLGLQLFFATASLQNGSQATTASFFLLLPYLFLLFLPALTMRTWSEERKLGTLELLMTFPVHISQLIAGKFGAALVFLTLMLALTLGFPITLAIYGDLDWKPVIGGYIGTMLMASAYLSVGMFWSSVTRDQIVAMLATLVTLAALFFIGSPAFLLVLGQILPEWLVGIINGISLNRYFASLSRGVLDSRDLVYYVSFCGFFLYANYLVLRGRRVNG